MKFRRYKSMDMDAHQRKMMAARLLERGQALMVADRFGTEVVKGRFMSNKRAMERQSNPYPCDAPDGFDPDDLTGADIMEDTGLRGTRGVVGAVGLTGEVGSDMKPGSIMTLEPLPLYEEVTSAVQQGGPISRLTAWLAQHSSAAPSPSSVDCDGVTDAIGKFDHQSRAEFDEKYGVKRASGPRGVAKETTKGE